MLIFKKKLEINDPSIKYISDWKDVNCNCIIDNYIGYGRYLLNKQLTGCGCTSYYLKNNENVILLSPRVKLLKDKRKKIPGLLYFNREKDETTSCPYFTIDNLKMQMNQYFQWCYDNNAPVKLLCTYDSFINMADILENDFKMNISQRFRIVIDECHSLIRDVKLKQFRNKCILSNFISRLFNYDNLLFVSATPIVDFLKGIDEFRDNDVQYYDMRWACAREIERFDHKCTDSKNAFDLIYSFYASHIDPYGRHYFDARFHADGTADYSYEAVIFLNNVNNIKRILDYYVKKKKLIDISDVTILCAETEKNRKTLKTVDKSLAFATSIPQEGEPHTTWTFVTSTCFWGVDFNSQCASTFVIANYYIPSLSLDIATDIPQIIGRQRVESNVFRNTLHIFFTNAITTINDQEFKQSQNDKLEDSKKQIRIYNDSAQDLKDIALTNLNKIIDMDPNGLYVSTVNGVPEIDELLIIAEDFSRYIVSNHHSWFIGNRSNVGRIRFNNITENLKSDLKMISGNRLTSDRIRKVYEYFCQYTYSIQREEFYEMLHAEGYGDIASYFNNLDLPRIYANGFDTSKMNNEIAMRRMGKDIVTLVKDRFESGKTYTKKEIKEGLHQIYESLGLKPKGTAQDLGRYCEYEEIKVNDNRVFRIK